jgi:hypothetical protein
MSEEQLVKEAKARQLGVWERYRLVTMITGVTAIAITMVGIALALYYSSGAALLDLSRPGYSSVSKQAEDNEQFDGFSASGAIDKKALDQFQSLYEERAKKATAIDSFGGDAMSDDTLDIK